MENQNRPWKKARVRWGKLGVRESGWVANAESLAQLLAIVQSNGDGRNEPIVAVFRDKNDLEWEVKIQ